MESYLMVFGYLNFLITHLTNLDFLLSHMTHFDNSIVLPLLVFQTFGFVLSVSFLKFKEYVSIFFILEILNYY